MKPEKRSVTINGHRTSISLEPAFWQALHEVADGRNQTIAALIGEIDQSRITAGNGAMQPPASGLSSTIRVYLLEFFQQNNTNVIAEKTKRATKD